MAVMAFKGPTALAMAVWTSYQASYGANDAIWCLGIEYTMPGRHMMSYNALKQGKTQFYLGPAPVASSPEKNNGPFLPFRIYAEKTLE